MNPKEYGWFDEQMPLRWKLLNGALVGLGQGIVLGLGILAAVVGFVAILYVIQLFR